MSSAVFAGLAPVRRRAVVPAADVHAAVLRQMAQLPDRPVTRLRTVLSS